MKRDPKARGRGATCSVVVSPRRDSQQLSRMRPALVLVVATGLAPRAATVHGTMTAPHRYTPEIESILAGLKPEVRTLAVEAYERAAAGSGNVYQDPSFSATAMKVCVDNARRALRPIRQLSRGLAISAADGVSIPTGAGKERRPCRHLTDDGNAFRLVDRHHGALRHVHEWGWLWYDGGRWNRDATREVMRRARETVRAIYDEAKNEPDSELSKKIGAHAVKSECAASLRAMVELAKSDPRVQARPGDFDRDPWLLNVANGTVDLRTGALRPHRCADLITKLIPVNYYPDALCLRWQRFLNEVMDGNERLVDYLGRAVGCSLAGARREQVLLFCYGTGNNGKTTFLMTLEAAFGDYAHQASPSLFLAHKNAGGPRDGIAQLCGARFVVAVEPEEGRRLNVALVKWLTGGDTLCGQFMYKESFKFRPTHTPWLAANHKPAISETTEGIWRRIHLVPFVVSFKGREDRELLSALLEELPGILAWAVRWCLEWQRIGLAPPEEVCAATREYRDEEDTFGEFIRARCVLEPVVRVPAGELRAAYTRWCEEAGETAESAKAVSERLKRDFGCKPGKGSKRLWAGIRLRSADEIQMNQEGGGAASL